MTTRFNTSIVFFVVLASALAVGAQTSSISQKPIPETVAAPCTPMVSVEGKENFDTYCAVCHGKDARGHGPAALAMKAIVPDLTTLAIRQGGKFDGTAVLYTLTWTGKTATPAHGVEDMPIWGQVFKSNNQASTTLRIRNLVKYLEDIQQPSTSR